MISVRALTKEHGSLRAVDDLTFDARAGTVTGFLGPNGAGKSTTMRVVMGLDRPTSGTALVDGRAYAGLTAPLREVGALLDAGADAPRAHRTRPPADRRSQQRNPTSRGRRGHRAGRPRRRLAPPHQDVLARHAPAPGYRRRPARRPRRAAVRRAGQRPGPRRRPVDPVAAARVRGGGAHGARVEPPHERDAAHRRPGRHHRARPADRRLDDRRGAAGPRRPAGAGPHPGGRRPRPSPRATRHVGGAERPRRARGRRDAAADVGAAAHAIGAQLHHLAEVEQSLEDAYLRLTEDSVEHHGRSPEPVGATADGAAR